MAREHVSISVIVACTANGVIGHNGDMPWKLRGDLKYFQQVTMDKPVIMGRKTFDSLGKPLRGRTNIVVTRGAQDTFPEGVRVCDSLQGAIELAKTIAWDSQVGEAFVIGGGQIYAEAINLADYLYVTHVEAELEGDTYFPRIEEEKWRLSIMRDGPPVDEHNTYPTKFASYVRR